MTPILILPRDDIEAYLKACGKQTVLIYNTGVTPLKPTQKHVSFSFFDLIDFDEVRTFLRYQITGSIGPVEHWEKVALNFVEEFIDIAEAARGDDTSLNLKETLDKIGLTQLGAQDIIDFAFPDGQARRFEKTFDAINAPSKTTAELPVYMESLQYITMQFSEIWSIHKDRYEDDSTAKLAPIFSAMYTDIDSKRKPFDVLVIENNNAMPVMLQREIPFIVGKYARIA
ncbi:MAG: hypothetical protein CL840_01365 [Crocinitomicaceae bacterium]|nr:hypothetical protein [Crocinitomicaceae bacterium]|tara:strand:+ start:23357 stop:24040 length:684 start_codon:yes stop_codon:yes gene_type:complete